MKATVENPRGIVEKLSPKESVEGADTVLRGSVSRRSENTQICRYIWRRVAPLEAGL